MSTQEQDDASGVGCFDPDCHADAGNVARDEMVACLVAFCDDCWLEWSSKDHISEVSI